MTVQDDQDWVQLLGLDRLPEHIVGKRVTELMDLSGKKAFVTGAGGDGLGQAIANRLAGCGAEVALIGRTFEKVERRAEEVERRWGVRAIPVKADMSDWDQVHGAVRQAHHELGGLDIMVNNPVMVAAGPFEKQTKEDIDYTVLGSLTMMMYGAHAALVYMLDQGSGRSSTSGRSAAAFSSAAWSSTTRARPASSGSRATSPTRSRCAVSTCWAWRRAS